jgi:isochorismate hydrolase
VIDRLRDKGPENHYGTSRQKNQSPYFRIRAISDQQPNPMLRFRVLQAAKPFHPVPRKIGFSTGAPITMDGGLTQRAFGRSFREPRFYGRSASIICLFYSCLYNARIRDSITFHGERGFTMSQRGAYQNVLIRKEDAVLVIIDMQDKLFRVMSEKEKLLENVFKLVRFARIVGLPVVVTEQQKLGDTLQAVREDLPDFKPIPKLTFDCFGVDAFRDRLKEVNRRGLIITGIEAHICVAQTALHALSDYEVHVVGDAVASRSPHDCEIALQRMARAGATITSTEMVIYELLERAGTDTFKEVLKLVK